MEFFKDSGVKEKKRSKLEILRDWFSIIVPSVTLIVTIVGFYNIHLNTYRYSLRPYVGITKSNVVIMSKKIQGILSIENSGKVPANNVRARIKHFINGERLNLDNDAIPEISIVVFPGNTMYQRPHISGSVDYMNKVLSGSKKWTMSVIIDYDGIATKGHRTEQFLEFDTHTKKFNFNKGSAN
jgi:hypothetical protein